VISLYDAISLYSQISENLRGLFKLISELKSAHSITKINTSFFTKVFAITIVF